MRCRILGMMSGTSLDGLDLALTEFEVSGRDYSYNVIAAANVPYDAATKERLLECETCSSERLRETDMWFGHFLGIKAHEFLSSRSLYADYIASHGQTVFHNPHMGYTLQIGDVNALASEVRCDVIGDFRSKDVALGGQGAPLVPIGDKLLYGRFPYCLNLGGFSNVSFDRWGKRTAWDICPVNMVLNILAGEKGLAYDRNGFLAESGSIDRELLGKLNSIPYYTHHEHYSLGKEWVVKYVFPLLEESKISTEDKLATYVEHISAIIADNLRDRTLVTGGGAYNSFLMKRIKEKTSAEIFIPDAMTVDYKEAIIFAFLGLRRVEGKVNALKNVTGAREDSCCGVIVKGMKR